VLNAAEPMVALAVERTFAADPEAVFDWITDGNNLMTARLVLRVRRTRDGEGYVWGKGARREVLAVGAWFREDIVECDRPYRYGYQIVQSFPPMRHLGGLITVTPVDGGGSRARWECSFDLPPTSGGSFVARLTKGMFASTFNQIFDAAKRQLG